MTPFPGMNPYLENPDLWSEVHHRLITAIAIAIAPSLRPKYRVAIEKRTYLDNGDDSLLVGIPDVAVLTQKSKPEPPSSVTTLPAQEESVTVILPQPQEMREGYLEIREVATGFVVTAIEILSPSNKKAGKGRTAYEEKRLDVLSRRTHLVEIDLLRGGKPMQVLSEVPATDYRIIISRINRRPLAQLYGFNLQQEIPSFLLPLRRGDTEPLIDIQTLLAEIYEQASFDMAIDYSTDPVPSLKAEDKAWVDELLQEKGLR